MIAEQQKIFEDLKDRMGYTNLWEVPRVTKVVVSTGVGKVSDPKKREIIQDRLARITGQKPASRGARQSIASFKLREGDVVGYQVTLRGKRKIDFLERLLRVAFPRTKDFKGFSKSSVDEMGNITVGIPEHTIFPEAPDEELKDIFGLSITIATTASTKEEALLFLERIGFPFQKDADE